MSSPPPRPTPLPYTTLFRSRAEVAEQARAQTLRFADVDQLAPGRDHAIDARAARTFTPYVDPETGGTPARDLMQRRRLGGGIETDRKSTRLNSSHGSISYAV